MYRIDFTRLARSAEEIVKDKASTEFLQMLFSNSDNRACNFIKSFNNRLPDGHIIDSIQVNEKTGFTGKQILEKFVLPKYSEATLLSWNEF